MNGRTSGLGGVAAGYFSESCCSNPGQTLADQVVFAVNDFNGVTSGKSTVDTNNTDRKQRPAAVFERTHCAIVDHDPTKGGETKGNPQLAS